MKYLKSFKEAVIIPDKMEHGVITTFSSLKQYGEQNGFDVVDYNEFYQSLPDEDKKTAPPRHEAPFFALFHTVRKKPMFVLSDVNALRFIPNFKEIVDDIIGHERVHAGQVSRRKGGEYVLPNPNIEKDYFSNKEEIMAFSWSMANQIAKMSKNFDESLLKFKSGRFGPMMTQLWNKINKVCSEEVVNRYRKMIYQYLDKMFKKDIIVESVDKIYHEIDFDEFGKLFDDDSDVELEPFSESESKMIFDLFSKSECNICFPKRSIIPNSIIEIKYDGNLSYMIWKFNDDWFYLLIDHFHKDDEIYKCDQIDGLIHCIKNKIESEIFKGI
jgi:hypothetical protein